MKYLVIFTTPVEGGWTTAHVDAIAIVDDETPELKGQLPYGWMPEEINGLYVSEMKYLVPITDPNGVEVISCEYDRVVPMPLEDVAVIINDATMGLDDSFIPDGDNPENETGFASIKDTMD